MYFCYVDEAGSAELLTASRADSTPAFVLLGVMIPGGVLRSVVWDFLNMKKRFRPQLARPEVKLDEVIRTEIKGSDLRADIRSGDRRRTRTAIGVIDKVIGILEANNCQFASKVYIKAVDVPMDDRKVYTSAVAEIATVFNSQLGAAQTDGIMILDGRTKTKNVANVHTITTRKYRAGGDSLPFLSEAPVFGHSDTHVPLQVADILVSAVLFPMACLAYCEHLSWSVHPSNHYTEIRQRFSERVRGLEYRYVDENGLHRGGVHVVDEHARRSTSAIFG